MSKKTGFVGEVVAIMRPGPEGVTVDYGGDVLDAAFAHAGSGGAAGVVTVIGDDPLSDGVLARMREAGIDTKGVFRALGRRLSIVGGEHRWSDRAAARALFALDEDPALAALSAFDTLHLSARDLAALSPKASDQLWGRLAELAAKGTAIVLIEGEAKAGGIDRFRKLVR